ncbi:hypothetical protein B4109_0927 [Geobacillus stearothermophilus]|uniref:Uncharacterized protein n=1 Tax=Geobacillus stearothermophilus TaxID=1422 RepID=A0A150MSW1_GEOSE|nr:hypothetical protein B4109_0927 [Geobacillus stearothermophilus]
MYIYKAFSKKKSKRKILFRAGFFFLWNEIVTKQSLWVWK